jgi:hypothetical protein
MHPEPRLIIRKIEHWDSVEMLQNSIYVILLFDGNKIVRKPVIRLPSGYAYFILKGRKYFMENYKENESHELPKWFKEWYAGNRDKPALKVSIEEKWAIDKLTKRTEEFLVSVGMR